jgi:hypothetical protein
MHSSVGHTHQCWLMHSSVGHTHQCWLMHSSVGHTHQCWLMHSSVSWCTLVLVILSALHYIFCWYSPLLADVLWCWSLISGVGWCRLMHSSVGHTEQCWLLFFNSTHMNAKQSWIYSYDGHPASNHHSPLRVISWSLGWSCRHLLTHSLQVGICAPRHCNECMNVVSMPH